MDSEIKRVLKPNIELFIDGIVIYNYKELIEYGLLEINTTNFLVKGTGIKIYYQDKYIIKAKGKILGVEIK